MVLLRAKLISENQEKIVSYPALVIGYMYPAI